MEIKETKEVTETKEIVTHIKCDVCGKLYKGNEIPDDWHIMSIFGRDGYTLLDICSIECYAIKLEAALESFGDIIDRDIDGFELPFAKLLQKVLSKSISLFTGGKIIEASKGRENYSKELIEAVKDCYPDELPLHRLAEKGDWKLGGLLDAYSRNGVGYSFIISAKTLEDVQEEARFVSRKLVVYNLWLTEMYDRVKKR